MQIDPAIVTMLTVVAVMQDDFLTPETIAAIGPLIPALQHATAGARITPGELFRCSRLKRCQRK